MNLDFYNKIANLRLKMIAPVDYSGHNAVSGKFEKLVALILSSRTKDIKVGEVMSKLDISKILAYTDEELKQIINGVSFADKKVEYLKKTAQIIKDQGIQDSEKFILSLPGIGKKSADIYMMWLNGNHEYLAIDTHLNRLFKRWKLVDDNNSADQTSIEMKNKIPKELLKDANQILVGFCQNICSSTPKCELCPIVCPSATGKNETRASSGDIEDIAKVSHSNVEWTIPENGTFVKKQTRW